MQHPVALTVNCCNRQHFQTSFFRSFTLSEHSAFTHWKINVWIPIEFNNINLNFHDLTQDFSISVRKNLSFKKISQFNGEINDYSCEKMFTFEHFTSGNLWLHIKLMPYWKWISLPYLGLLDDNCYLSVVTSSRT